jgi:hypothetical protein
MNREPMANGSDSGHSGPEPRTAFVEVVIATGQGAARSLLREREGRFAVVVRDTPRAALFDCPCGCGEVVVINTDPRTGPAWRIRIDPAGATLMPSVWRTTGCRSHFIIWRSRIWWCRFREQEDVLSEPDNPESCEVSGSRLAAPVLWPEEMDAELRDEWRRIRLQRRRPTR